MISAELQAELRARFNPEGSDLRRHQMRMLEMLKYIDRICRENNINYWLSSGTCLGAVRHGGFIPWDDDVDIEMLATDYERLRGIITNTPDAPYSWHDSLNDSKFYFPFAKLRDKKSSIMENNPWNEYYNQHGIYIDIFRLYPSGMRKLEIAANWYHHKFVLGIAKRKSPLLRKHLIKLTYWIMENIISPTCRNLTKLNAHELLRHRIGSEFIKPRYVKDVKSVVRVPFEDTELPIPAGYDSYLSHLYGDYLQIPEISKINEPHTCSITYFD